MSNQREQVQLTAHTRKIYGKQVNRLRREGWVPGVMYGHGYAPVALQFEERHLRQVLPLVSGSQLIHVALSDQGMVEMALIRDVQVDPITRALTHIDLYRVTMTERIRTEVHLALIGEAPAVKRGEGILLHGISAIEVECLPSDLVDAIEVDLSSLEAVDQGIFVRDLTLPSGIETLTDPDEMIVRVVPLEVKAEELPAEVAAPAEVEVIREAKASKEAEEESE